MKEFSPEEQKDLNKKREINDVNLAFHGAEEKRDGRLEVTREQLEEAAVEKYLSEKGPKVTFNEIFEISEVQPFTLGEIIDVISKFEDLDPKDFSVIAYTINASDEIIDASIRLREDVAYDKFGRDTVYIYEIRGFTRSKEHKNYFDVNEDDMDVPRTTIAKLFQNSDTEELNLRNEVKMEYARTEEERDAGLNEMAKIGRTTDNEDFLTFDERRGWVRE